MNEDKMLWHIAADDAFEFLKAAGYDFEKAHGFLDELSNYGSSTKDAIARAWSHEILDMLEKWSDKEKDDESLATKSLYDVGTVVDKTKAVKSNSTSGMMPVEGIRDE